MKSSTIFLVTGIIIVSVGLAWIVNGGPAAPAQKDVPQTTNSQVTADITKMTMAIPLTTAPVTTTVTVAPAVTTTQVKTTSAPASAEDIRDHFLDVAYSTTSRLERLNYSASKPRVTIIAVSAGDEDIALIEKTAKDFNDASPTVKLSENIKDTGSGDLVIKFLPVDGLSAISLMDAPETGPFPDVLTRRELYQGGVPAAKIIRGTIYLNANLKDDIRKHVLVRSLMYEMGLTGESSKFSDSVFSAAENTNVDLTPADKRVISMLYTQGNYNGMTMEELQKVIYFP
jgi:hypothetical protein